MRPEVAVILAGGVSRRMGRDKAAIAYGGTTLLGHVCGVCREAGLPVVVAGRADFPESLEEVLFLPDEVAGLGPLGGLVTALESLRKPVALLACDAPGVSASALCWLVETAAGSTARHGVVVRHAGQLEPLFSVYTPDFLETARLHLASRFRSMRAAIGDGDFDFAEVPAKFADALLNMNSAGDLALFLEQSAQQRGV
ncbi:MAG: molybdenum cofactor guanylyltransferase [Candidatus Sumerlaeaceae bacterium]|nr:molybdenum cofactor guanylyltransferase [Candidatus Sumerlaeaceae bacterium]